MVNIIAGSKIIPELIQQDCTPAKIAESVSGLLNKDTRARMREELGQVKAKLGTPGASQRAAKIIHKMVKEI
jgi:lipid-A-disaccharide synthase